MNARALVRECAVTVGVAVASQVVVGTVLVIAGPAVPAWLIVAVAGVTAGLIAVVVWRMARAREVHTALAGAWMRSSLDAMPAAMLVVADDGRIVMTNAVARSVFQYPDGALECLTIEALMPAAARAAHVAQREAFVESRRVRAMGSVHDLDALRADGTTFAAQVGLGRWIVGATSYTVAAVIDVTLMRQAEAAAALESFEASAAASVAAQVFQAAPVGILLYDVESGQCLNANPSAARITGLSVAQLRAQRYREVASWQVSGLLEMAELAAAGTEQERRLVNFVTSAGMPVHAVAAFVPVAMRGRRALVLILDDRTGEFELQRQLVTAQKMEAIGQLAGGVAHDFNNLLTVIQSYTGLLLEEFGADAPHRDDLVEILSATTRATMLTRQLLAVGRRQLLDAQPVDLREIIGGLEHMLRRTLPSALEMVVEADEGLGTVKADPGQLEQAFMNLIINARDAMTLGGRLTIRLRNANAAVAGDLPRPVALVDRDAVVAEFSDTGTGMDAATQARLFEPFFTTKGAGKGTGLGLSTTYGIVQQSGGAITVESAVGRGSTFRVWLPLAATDSDPLPDDAPPDLRGAERIFVVEDNPAVRRLCCSTLRRLGYDVLEAQDGQEALTALGRMATPPDLLLTDVVMPGVDGAMVAARARQQWPDIPVLFMSGYAPAALAQSGVLSIQGRVLRKPFDGRDLALAVRQSVRSDGAGGEGGAPRVAG